MAETPARGPKPLTGRVLRPKPLGHVWAWIVLAVGMVILTAITLWVVTAGKTKSDGLSDKQVIHDVSSRWRVRWAQVPGPHAEYLRSADKALTEHRLADAARLLSMSISLESGDAAVWLKMACVSVAYPSAYQMTDVEIDKVVSILAETPPTGLSELAKWRDQRRRLSDKPDETRLWVAACARAGDQSEQIESPVKTLDTIEGTP